MLLYLVGTVDRLPPASPLLKGTRLPVDSILQGAGLMTGQKSATLLTSCTQSSLSAQSLQEALFHMNGLSKSGVVCRGEADH